MVSKKEVSLWGFVSAVVVTTYYTTDKNKLWTVAAGLASYLTHRQLFPESTPVVEKTPVSEPRAATPPPPPTPVEVKPTDPVRKKVVAFDFDKCLMTRHWWGTYRNTDLEQINPVPEDFAHSSIGAVMKNLMDLNDSDKNNLTVVVAVASFGRKDIIAKAIQSVLEPEYAQRVFITTPGDYEMYKDGFTMGTKNTQLRAISSKFDTALEDIIFFDDDRKNIDAADKIGVNAVVAAPFNRDLEGKIYEHIEQPQSDSDSSA